MPKQPLQALFLEDNPNDATLIGRDLRGIASLTVCNNREAFQKAIKDRDWPVVLVDINVPGFSGQDAIRMVKDTHPLTPVIIVTGSIEAKAANKACELGAFGFVLKEQREGLGRMLENAHETKLLKQKNHQLEQQTQRDQRNAMIGELLGGVAHDSNNSLQLILGSTEYLRTRISPMDEFVLDKIHTATMHCAELMKQCVTFAKGFNGGDFKPLTADYILTELRILLQGSFPRNIKIEIAITPGTAKLMGNKAQLQEVLVNLCINARDAMPNGGTLKIEAMNATLGGTLNGEFVCFIVADDGTGIPYDVLPRIWDLFFTTKSHGSGIGLSRVRTIVENHGGGCDVESIPGRTAFSIYIPIEPKAHPIRKPQFDGTGRTVLCVDDEDGARFLLPIQLETANFKSIVACNGVEAMGYFQRGEKIDLLLVDERMPLMSGSALIQNLRAHGIHTPAIILTGYDSMDLVTEVPVLPKPYTIDELIVACKKALETTEFTI